MDEELLPTSSAAEYINRTSQTLLRHQRRGDIKAMTYPGKNERSGYVFRKSDLDELKRFLGQDEGGSLITNKEIREIYRVNGRSPARQSVRTRLTEFGIDPVSVGRNGEWFYDRAKVLIALDEIWERNEN
jgi:hypothetical protein